MSTISAKRINACTLLAVNEDMKQFEKHGQSYHFENQMFSPA